jgi:hypothetical protein
VLTRAMIKDMFWATCISISVVSAVNVLLWVWGAFFTSPMVMNFAPWLLLPYSSLMAGAQSPSTVCATSSRDHSRCVQQVRLEGGLQSCRADRRARRRLSAVGPAGSHRCAVHYVEPIEGAE